MRSHRVFVFVALTNALLANPSVSLSDAAVFGTLSAADLDELRALQPSKRGTRLRELGLAPEDWLPEFLHAAQRVTGRPHPVEKPDEQTMMRALYGSMLVELLCERQATDALKQMASVRDPLDSIFTYGALLALDALGTEQEFLLSMLDHPNRDTAAFAILTLGVHDSPTVAKAIERVKEARSDVPQISDFLQFIKLYHHDVTEYSKLPSVDERVQFVRQRLPYNPIIDATDWLDPYTGGDPLARWAAARWAELSREAAPRVAAAIQGVNYDPPEVGEGYRQFLIRLADPALKKHLPERRK